jgi:hypothetical protein
MNVIRLIKFLIREDYLSRTVALFFILFTFWDISLPQICREETLLMASDESSSITSNHPLNITTHPVINVCHKQQSAHHSESRDEDCCFCCCVHWLPAKKLRMAINIMDIPRSKIRKILLPQAPSQNTFHPPRTT